MAGTIVDAFRKRADLSLSLIGVLLAFALRYWFLWNYPYPLMLHEQDGIAYMGIAKDILAFRAPGNVFMPPFYPLVIASFSILPVKLELAARIASITMDSLVVLPLYGLARIILPRLPAFAVGLLWATFGFSLYFSPSPLSQSSYLCMLLTGIYLLYRALTETGRLNFFAIAGACFCAAYQTRPEGVAAMGAAVLLTFAGMLRRDADRRYHLRGLMVLVLAFVLCALPYILLLRSSLGHWTFTAKTTVAIKGIDGSLVIGAKDQAKGGLALWLETFGGVTGGLNFIKANIAGFFATLQNTFPLWGHIFALVGLIFVFASRGLYRRLFLLVPFIVTIPVYVANLPKTHSYIYPLFPLHMLLFVAGVWGVISLVRQSVEKLLPSLPSPLLAVVAAVVLFVPVAQVGAGGVQLARLTFTAPDLLFQVEQTNKVFRAAGEDIRAVSAPEDVVMSRWGLVTYFADRPLMVMPKGSIDDVLAAGRKSNARYILIDTESVLSRRQELVELLDPLYGRPLDPRHGLEIVTMRSTDLGSYIIYRFR